MDRSTVIYLISEDYTQDDYGVMRRSETRRKIFAQVQSVTGQEWFDGGRNGLNPELRFLIFAPEYSGEEVVEYNGVKYSIYRTYTARNDILELYTEKRKGKE